MQSVCCQCENNRQRFVPVFPFLCERQALLFHMSLCPMSSPNDTCQWYPSYESNTNKYKDYTTNITRWGLSCLRTPQQDWPSGVGWWLYAHRARGASRRQNRFPTRASRGICEVFPNVLFLGHDKPRWAGKITFRSTGLNLLRRSFGFCRISHISFSGRRCRRQAKSYGNLRIFLGFYCVLPLRLAKRGRIICRTQVRLCAGRGHFRSEVWQDHILRGHP
jgi:hypothetical protein